MSNVTSDTMDWLKGAGEDFLTGIDDAICGWAEIFTNSRKEKLENAAKRLERMQENARSIEQFYGELTRSHNEVVQALALQMNKFSSHFEREGTGWGLDAMRIGQGATVVVSGVAGVTAGAAQVSVWVAKLWTLAGNLTNVSTAAANVTQIEMALLGNLAAAGADAAAIANAAHAGTAAATASTVTKLQNVAKVAGTVALVAGGVIVVLQTVLQGIQVAHLRNELKKIDKSRTELEPLIGSLKNQLLSLRDDLKGTYTNLTPKINDKHVIEFKSEHGDEAPIKVVLEEFFDNITRLPELIDNGGGDVQKKFDDLRSNVVSQNTIIRNALQSALSKADAAIQVLIQNANSALIMFHDGFTPTQVKRYNDSLPTDLVEKIYTYYQGTKGNPGGKIKLKRNAEGNYFVTSA